MSQAVLSPDGHALAFLSPTGGYDQVFVMLTSGGDPLQLTSDEGSKFLDAFAADGTQIYYGKQLGADEVWAVPTLGGTPVRVVEGGTRLWPSADGKSLFWIKVVAGEVMQSPASGGGGKGIFNFKDLGIIPIQLLAYPEGDAMLIVGTKELNTEGTFDIYKLDLASHKLSELGTVSGNGRKITWGEPGKTVLLARDVNGIVNLWDYDLTKKSYTQLTSGPGPDYLPMKDPAGKGIFFVNGKNSGSLSVYHLHTKTSSDVVSDVVSQPTLSPDGKRFMYLINPEPTRSELWVADIDGKNKLRLASSRSIGVGDWSPDGSQVTYTQTENSPDRLFVVNADGSHSHEVPLSVATVWSTTWSQDGNNLYVSGTKGATRLVHTEKIAANGGDSAVAIADGCGYVTAALDSNYLLMSSSWGERLGIFELSVADKTCTVLVPGVTVFQPRVSSDGRYVLYTVSSRGEVSLYRLSWHDGKAFGAPQLMLKLPFAFPQSTNGNAYDVARDLSNIAYVRSGGEFDLYLLSRQ